MSNNIEEINIPCITNDGVGESYFTMRQIQLSGDDNRRLSEQIDAVNFRLRTSTSDYCSGFHVAGDPTLLIMLSGSIKIVCRMGDSKTFKTGDMFIADDFLASGIEFNDQLHGHQAKVIGDEPIQVLHLKLSKRK